MSSSGGNTSKRLLRGFSILRGLLNATKVITLPIVLSAVSAFLLSSPDQTKEVYRVIAQDLAFSAGNWLERLSDFREIGLVIIGLIFLGITFWHVAKSLSGSFTEDAARRPPSERFISRWAPTLIAIIPLLGASWGFWDAQMDPSKKPPLSKHSKAG